MIMAKTITYAKLVWLVTFFYSSYSFALRPSSLDETITIAVKVNSAYLPGKLSGYLGKEISCVFNRMGQKYRFVELPWKRAQFLTKQGEVQGFFRAVKNNKRDQYASHVRFETREMRYYALANTPIDFNKLSSADNNNYGIGVAFGGFSERWAKKQGFNITFSPQENTNLTKGLLLKRVSVIITSKEVMNQFISLERRDPADFKSALAVESPAGIYFSNIFLNEHKGFLTTFNSHVATCIKQFPNPLINHGIE